MKKGLTSWPAGFAVDDEMREYGLLHTINPEVEFESFRDHHLAKGSRFADWGAAWRTWCRNAEKYKNEKRTIGFTAPIRPALNMVLQQAQKENELAAEEARLMTPERRRELGKVLSVMVAKIGAFKG